MRVLALTIGAMCGVASAPCFAVAASEHEHMMDHSMHEHQLSSKSPSTSSVSTYSIPDVTLVDMNGTRVALREVLNSKSPIILNFIFTSCTTICPVMSATFQQVQQKLGPKRSNARMVSISIDPENDTPAKLKDYAQKYKVEPQWKLLTGSLDDSIAVQRAFGVFAGDKMNQKPATFLKAKGADNSWLRLDGLVEAKVILQNFDKLNSR